MTELKRWPIGERVLRLEDGPLLAGEGKFSADWSFPDMLYMHVVRSSVASVSYTHLTLPTILLV